MIMKKERNRSILLQLIYFGFYPASVYLFYIIEQNGYIKFEIQQMFTCKNVRIMNVL